MLVLRRAHALAIATITFALLIGCYDLTPSGNEADDSDNDSETSTEDLSDSESSADDSDSSSRDDLCIDVYCNEPPPSHCLDNTILRSYSAADAWCHSGQCGYPASDHTCDQGCANHQCNNDPCAGIICDAGPDPECNDDVLWVWDGLDGSCNLSNCRYEFDTTNCPSGCNDGACNGDPCLGIECNTPPANRCDDDNKVWYSPTGTCVPTTGDCAYTEQTLLCPFSCSVGHCDAFQKPGTSIEH